MTRKTFTLGAGESDATISSGEVHTWHWAVPAETFVSLEVFQQGIDLEVRLFSGDADQPERIVDGIDGPFEIERLAVAPETEVAYRIEIEPLDANAGPTTYRIVASESVAATAAHRAEVEAEVSFDAGERGRRGRTTESRRQALRAYRRALEGFPEGDPGKLRALQRLGGIYEALGERAEARIRYGALLELAQRFDDQAEVAMSQNRLGQLDFGENSFDRAQERFEIARDLSRKLKNRVIEARSLNNLASLKYRREDLAGAIRDFEAVARLWQELGRPRDRATALFNLAAVLQAQGKWREALDAWLEVESIRSSSQDPEGAALALVQSANCRRLLGQPEKALADLEKALALGVDLAPHLQAMLANDRGLLKVELGQKEAAVQDFEAALALAEANDMLRPEAIARLNLAALRRDLGSPVQGLAELGRAREIFQQVDDQRHLAACDLIDAWLSRDRGDHAAALVSLEKGVDRVEVLRLAHSGWGLRMAFFESRQTYYDEMLDLLVERYRATEDTAYLERAFHIGERRRARSLLDALGEGRLSFRGDAALLDEERQVREELAKVEKNLDLADPAQREHLEPQQRLLLVRLDIARAEIQRSSPQYSEIVRPKPLKVDELRDRLFPGKVVKRVPRASLASGTLPRPKNRLLVYELGERRSFLFSLTDQGVLSLYDLPPRQRIENLAGEASLALASTSSDRADRNRRIIEDLSDALLAPIADELGEERLAIVADGALAAIPFSALIRPRASGDRGAAGRRPWVLEHHEVVHLPSASTLVALRDEILNRPAALYQFAVFANPVFTKDDPRVNALNGSPALSEEGAGDEVLRDSLARGGFLAPLPATAREADAIRAFSIQDRSLFVEGFGASREAFENPEIEDFWALHFATHGILDSDQAELSGLVLSMVDEEGSQVDGFIRAHELYGRRFNAELVVLSACQTGRGQVVRGEGAVGLPRGFLYAGVPRVVVSLWNVADSPTAELMTSFYGHLEAGFSPAAALRKSQLEMLRNGAPGVPERLPAQWAPFIFIGDWIGGQFTEGGVGQEDDGTVVLTDPSKGGAYDVEESAMPESESRDSRSKEGIKAGGPASGNGRSPNPPAERAASFSRFVNGVDERTGRFLSPEPSDDPKTMELSHDEWHQLQHWIENRDQFRLPVHGVDPEKLEEAGWGVLFGAGVKEEEREALGELLTLRKGQAGDLYQKLDIPRGVDALEFLEDKGQAYGRVVPAKLPYYLLLVGDPADLPFDFQYRVDVQHAVGRLHLDSAEAYEAYAGTVKRAEEASGVGREGLFWTADIPGDDLTAWMRQGLSEPLLSELEAWRRKSGLYEAKRSPDGRKGTLLEALREPPAFLFTASHGLVVRDDAHRQRYQGSLLCEDWDHAAPVHPGVYFSPDDFAKVGDLQGLITMHFACYSAGSSIYDPFQPAPVGGGKKLNDRPFVSELSRSLLQHGAQAVIGHVDRAWPASFEMGQGADQSPVMASMLKQLFEGHRVGHATEPINSRYAELAAALNPLLVARPRPNTPSGIKMRNLQVATLDARNYVVIGDPAVRLVGAAGRSRLLAERKARKVLGIPEPAPS